MVEAASVWSGFVEPVTLQCVAVSSFSPCVQHARLLSFTARHISSSRQTQKAGMNLSNAGNRAGFVFVLKPV